MTTQDPKYKHKPSEKHTLEEVLKSLQDLIRNDLLDNDQAASEKSATTPTSSEAKPQHEYTAPVREDFAPVNPAAGPVNLDAVMRSLKDLVSNELNVGGEPAATEESPPSRSEDHEAPENLMDEFISLNEELTAPESSPPSRSEGHEAPENLADEFVPLDEELTFEESMETVPPPLSEPATPEVPGEISAEMLSEPEPDNVITPPPVAETETNIVSGTQHQLPFEEAPPPVVEPEPTTEPELVSSPDSLSQTETGGVAPEMTQETTTPDTQDVSGNTLPTIDVEENFDENAYFEAEAKQAEASSADSQVTQEIIMSALAATLGQESAPPADNEQQESTEILPSESEPGSDASKPEINLETANEPTPNKLENIPSIDFHVVEFESSREEPPASPAAEIPAPDAADVSFAQELTLESEAGAVPPSSAETKPDVAPTAEQIPDTATSPLDTGETQTSPPATEPSAPETMESIDLDDIPVLHEVVAPPAGSTLVGKPVPPDTEPPLPAPDRARDIVVRAVAKLNVEMRKSGGAGLDTKTILRLQQLIRRELEKDGDKS